MPQYEKNCLKKYLYLVIVVLFFVYSGISFAINKEAIDTAKRVSEYAEVIMKARQNGAPIASMIDINHKQGASYAGASDLLDSMTIEAYKIPQYSSPEFKKKAITDFKNKWYIKTLQLFSEKEDNK
jgi:hypothetical protein